MNGEYSAARVLQMALACVLLMPLPSLAQAKAESAPRNRPLRLAIMEFLTSAETESLRAQSSVLVDLLTTRLTSEEGFELVERAAINKVLREIGITLSGMTKRDQ